MTYSSLSLPQQLYHAGQVRELDRIAIEDHAIPGLTLMQRAGKAAFEALQTKWPQAKQIIVLCGTGNNGGDGYVLAKLAYESGMKVSLMQVGDAERIQGDARQAVDDLTTTGLIVETYTAAKLAKTDVLVDALFGTGLDREINGIWKNIIEEINKSEIPILAIDIPSGLNADTGQPMGCAVEADVTISFIGLKQGLFTGQGQVYSGNVIFNDLEVPQEIYSAVPPDVMRVEFDYLKSLLPARPRAAHKGHFGHVLVIGGDSGFIGAACMAGEAAARTGAGLVSIATRAEHAADISTNKPELMVHGVETPKQLLPLLTKANIIAIGPGLGQSQWALALFSKVLESNLPMVVDADALNLLAKEPVQNENWILTPHPGEASRLLACDTSQIQSDRFAAVRKLQQRYSGVVLLKGNGTIIIDSEGDVAVCTAGNPGMASGGMGDVLTGVIAGLVAQGLSNDTAACLGVCLHAEAADRAATNGERGMLATDLMPHLRTLVNVE
jgi:NAD(P)H-hydrate epimerase